jgi:hypothetical protein
VETTEQATNAVALIRGEIAQDSVKKYHYSSRNYCRETLGIQYGQAVNGLSPGDCNNQANKRQNSIIAFADFHCNFMFSLQISQFHPDNSVPFSLLVIIHLFLRGKSTILAWL